LIRPPPPPQQQQQQQQPHGSAASYLYTGKQQVYCRGAKRDKIVETDTETNILRS